jgi:hypothetical protein
MTDTKLFTTWFTSQTDDHDHAVTDEEFFAHRPCPTAICGDEVPLLPLTCPNGPCCPRCVDILLRRRVPVVPQQHRHRAPGLLARLLGAHTPVVPSPRALARDDRPPTPVASPAAGTAVGAASHPRQVAPTVNTEDQP